MLCCMTTVVVTSVDSKNSQLYTQVMENLGVDVRLYVPENAGLRPTEELMTKVGGLPVSASG